jgi:hypothetical protein
MAVSNREGTPDMEQDTDVTPVIFRVAPGGDVTAVFPCEPHSLAGDLSCYAHVGQHSGASLDWYKTTRAAKHAEYEALKQELEAAPYGYRLKVYRRMTPQHREAFNAELKRLRAR